MGPGLRASVLLSGLGPLSHGRASPIAGPGFLLNRNAFGVPRPPYTVPRRDPTPAPARSQLPRPPPPATTHPDARIPTTNLRSARSRTASTALNAKPQHPGTGPQANCKREGTSPPGTVPHAQAPYLFNLSWCCQGEKGRGRVRQCVCQIQQGFQ